MCKYTPCSEMASKCANPGRAAWYLLSVTRVLEFCVYAGGALYIYVAIHALASMPSAPRMLGGH